jgi:hypothetical protein
MCSPAKVSRMETAGRTIQARDVRDLCRYYGVGGDLRDELMALTADARKRGWWQDYRALDEQTQTYVGLEAAAVEMREFETFRMPGLLQTPEYTRAWVQRMRTPGFWQPGQVDEIVEVRARRQKHLFDGGLQLHAIVDEAAFTRVVGSIEVMAEQVKRLASWAQLDNVDVQVTPLSAEPHPGLDGSFQYLKFTHGGVGNLIYIEGLFGSQFLDKPDEVERYLDVYRYLSCSVALSTEATIEWLARRHQRLVSGSRPSNSRPEVQ